MCDVCADVLELLYSHDQRLMEGEGLRLTKNETFALMLYAQAWQQRQCMCCFKDIKNFERLNNIVQVAMNMAIMFIVDLPFDCQEKSQRYEDGSGDAGLKEPWSNPSEKSPREPSGEGHGCDEQAQKSLDAELEKENENIDVEMSRVEDVPDKPEHKSKEPESENESSEENKSEADKTVKSDKEKSEEEHHVKPIKEPDKEQEPQTGDKHAEEKKEEASQEEGEGDMGKSADKEQDEKETEKVDEEKATEEKKSKEIRKAERDQQMEAELKSWSLEEKDRLFHFITKIFLMNFPLYMAYKHSIQTSLEELSQQEASALNNYCELSDPEVPVYLLRNVCFFCDRNGIQSIAQCFDRASPEILPYTVAHTLINIIANLRLWMNINTVMQHIVPLRSQVIRYMCRLSDNDLRMAGTRNMTDLMWAAVKEPIETHISFDREGLDLAFKYFTCTTLTIRLAGITQINNQINLYNEIANTNDSLLDADNIGNQLAGWLIESKIIEHIFGPNLHVELIKQSQMILNFLALESRITNEHIDFIWAAGQLKHCSRQVHDILIPLIKNLEIHPAQHLLKLVSGLEPSAHTEQTLYLASALTKFLWNTAAAAQSHVATVHHQGSGQGQQYTALSREHEEMETEVSGHGGKHAVSSSEHSESGEASEEEELAERPMRRRHHVHHKRHKAREMEGGKQARRTPVLNVESGEEVESENSSLCANSELSDISDESLPSDLSEHEQGEVATLLNARCRHKHARKRHHHHRGAHHHMGMKAVGESGCSETSDDMDMEHLVGDRCSHEHRQQVSSQHRRKHMRHHTHRLHSHHQHKMQSPEEEETSSEEDEEEEDDEEEDDEEEEDEEEEEEEEYMDSDDPELMKHVKVVDMQSEEENEESSEEEEESEEFVQAATTLQRQQQSPEKDTGSSPLLAEKKTSPKKVKSPVKVKNSSPEKASSPQEEENSQKEEDVSVKPPSKPVTMEEPQPSTSTGQGHLSSSPKKEAVSLTEDMMPDLKALTQSSDSEHGLGDYKDFLNFSQDPSRRHGHIQSDLMENIHSPDEGSCHSSRMSTKSEKNMADFEDEDVLSDDELAHINAQAGQGGHFTGGHHMQQHLANMASMYKCIPQSVIHHHGKQDSGAMAAAYSSFKFEDVCKTGQTLLWDLLQEHTAYKLAEGIAAEAEKVLCSLVCFSTDRRIRTRFIEACVENIANHRSVVISLRLLPRLFGSFQQYRVGLDTHAVTMWAEKELNMTKHFFNNLVFFTNAVKRGNLFPHALYSYREEIQVRLQFLTCIFSTMGSQESFRLDLGQVDTLWSCLATDAECADDCFNWFLNQARSKEHHAMSLCTFKHIFMEKMPTLKPEDMSMVGLNLFTQLCSLARVANASLDNPLSEDQISGMDQLWGIALRAQNTDVSLNAIQYLNNHYINYGSGILEKEEEFVQRCMDSLTTASSELGKNHAGNLLVIQRGLILLTNHLESFRRRYAFHMRNWQLDGHGISSHQKSLQDKNSIPIRVVLQPAGSSEKTTIEMLNTDLVAELRAEVTCWWETMQKLQQQHRQQQQQDQQSEQSSQNLGQSSGHQGTPTISTSQMMGGHRGGAGSMLTPILGAMLGDGPVRMITLGQELTIDVDEKTLGEMQFKDLQLVFVSLGASRPPRKHDGSTPVSYLSPPPREKLPMMLLLGEPHFGQLLSLLQQLSGFRCNHKDMDSQEQQNLQVKARVLSRKVWELLMLLPTNTDMFEALKAVNSQSRVSWDTLLDSSNPYKLMYSLQVIESLSRRPKHRRQSIFQTRSTTDSHRPSTDSEMSVEEQELPEEVWSRRFVSCGGLRHLYQVFLNGSLQTEEGGHWNEWKQDCLAYLLRLMSQFALTQAEVKTICDEVFENSFESPKKRAKKQKPFEKILIPTLNQAMLSMIDVERVLKILMSILYDAAMPKDSSPWHQASWGRTEVVHYALSFLVSWAHSCEEVRPVLCGSDNFSSWLKRLTLDAPEPQVRQEACRGLYRLCLGHSLEGKTGYEFLVPTMASMLTFLDDAQKMKPAKKMISEEKEPYGPGCRDYFWLLCHLVDKVSPDDAVRSWEQQDGIIDLNGLAKHVAELIVQRPYLERRHNTVEDDGLFGLLHLYTAIAKHNPPFKNSTDGQTFLVEVFWCLFALPSPKQRYLPKCKSMATRSAAFDLMVEMARGSLENYAVLHEIVLKQHYKDSHSAYSWDNWPHEEGRSNCGYVGLTNLGATCYLATCMQHLYMIPQARKSVLEAKLGSSCQGGSKHEGTLMELQKMFAYLMDSERKAYNPRSFCKVYTMDKLPLNTGEQKDMAEFFTDLISKLEDMGPDLKRLVKTLFGGVTTNNVVSLDCPHVSRTMEEFYTVRCQVSDMKNLYESLDEVTVKDMLEGDNMYTCSKCQKKVRAEKRACFRRLPKILCFNTMRYTFNMVTMMKEKVNSHFSFPLILEMPGYMEENLIQSDKLPTDEGEKDEWEETKKAQEEGYTYELIGVTVHTGTADGGHYYSFIRDRLDKNELGQDRWYLFNDAEVKPFDPQQIASECFGGEMTSKTYDSVTDKFMDFSFEKTNSAYMLFYERIRPGQKSEYEQEMQTEEDNEEETPKFKVDLSKELADWIWQDNMQFLQDKNIFEHTYFGFMWQMCSYIPSTLPRDDPEVPVPLMAAKLSASFVLETLIHAKEKPTMLQWIELLTKQFNACHAACEWFLDSMAEQDWWPQQILIKCPNQVVRQMFQRLLIHVITQLKPNHAGFYLQPVVDSDDELGMSQIGSLSCVTRFIRRMLGIMEGSTKPHCRYLAEYFAFLHEFAKMGDDEAGFLLHSGAISTIVNFYMGHKTQETYVEILSDDDEEEEEDVISLSEDKYRPQSLEKMISLVAMLVEKSRGDDKQLHLSQRDYLAIISGKGYPFLFSQIRDSINLRSTCNLIFSLCRWNDRLAMSIVQMIFGSISRLTTESQPFFKILSMLVEFVGGPPGQPGFTNYVLHKFWDVTDYCPQQCLEWLSTQVMRNKIAHGWTLSNMDMWVEAYLLAHTNLRVRNAAANLLVSLVPSQSFRQAFRSSRSMISPHKDVSMSQEAVGVFHDVYRHLLRLLPRARQYVDVQNHGALKLVPYFALMTYCLVSRVEKLMFSRYFLDLWQLFQPKLSEPAISMHHNKQALLLFWYQVCTDCPENVKLIVSNAHVTKNIAFNYILADHDDQDVVLFNRCMLPAYYGILRTCCQQSRSFTRQLSMHQNIQWAFKNITPYPAQYTAAVDELFKMMRLMVMQYPNSSDEERNAIAHFRRTNIQLFLQNLEARTSWQTLIRALKILMESLDDQLLVLYQQGLPMLQEAFNTLHVMHHEATACHVTGDIVDLLSIMLQVLKVARHYNSERKGDHKSQMYNWKDRMDFVRKLLTFLNSYTPPDIRQFAIDVLKEMLLNYQNECVQTCVTILLHAHTSFQDNNMPVGPYFPKRGQKPIGPKSSIRPPRPQFQMLLHSNQLEASRGADENYDAALNEFFTPYHSLVDLLMRVSVNNQNLTENIVNLSAAVAYEGVPLHMPYFAKLWYEIYTSEHVDKKYVQLLCNSGPFIDYVDAVLLDERQSLNSQHIYQFFCNYFPKVYQQVLSDQGQSLLDSIIASITADKSTLENVHSDRDVLSVMQRLNGDLRALLLIFSVQTPRSLSNLLQESLHYILDTCHSIHERRTAAQAEAQQQQKEAQAQQQVQTEVIDPGKPDVREDDDDCGLEEIPRKRRRTDSGSSDNDKDTSGKPSPTHEQQPSTSIDSAADSEPKMDTMTTEKEPEEPLKEGQPAEEIQVEEVEMKKKESNEETSDKSNSDEPKTETPVKKCSEDQMKPSSPSSVTEPSSPTMTQKSTCTSNPTGLKTGEPSTGKPGTSNSGRMPVREKPTLVEAVAKNIELVFSMINKK